MADTFIRTDTEKQGYLGNLENHTKTQLEELLKRQQKLLNNKSFINKLPDRGKKIRTFAEQLQQKIKELEVVDQTASLFTQMKIRPETNIEDDDPLKQMLNPRIKEKQINYESDESNSYAKVIQKIDSVEPKTHYRAYQTIKAKNISEIPKDKLPSQSPSVKDNCVIMETNTISRKLKNKGKLTTILESDSPIGQPVETIDNRTVLSKDIPDDVKTDKSKGASKKTIQYEGVLAYRPKGTHESSITLSMEESLNLQKEQAKKQQTLQAIQASERLAQTVGVKMQPYNPEGNTITQSYRDNKSGMSDDTDSDDDENEQVDYPE
ncbi:unnamed protein product [Owenia fusiformis]|uniref:Uncharacterized protein n=1 Tax=Owenia fusiformis TaxID=6347 RepID=A0A8J1TXD7_OWEFU|nr:unnamed protein product [Owenia fusiformis]